MIAFTFGRFQPPTKGHINHIKTMVRYAQQKGIPHTVYISSTVNQDNPLSVNDRVAILKQAIPEVNVQSAVNMFEVLKYIDDDVAYFAGNDYKNSQLIENFCKHATPNSTFVLTGSRIDGISSTDAKQAAQVGDLSKFADILAPVNEETLSAVFNSIASK